MCIHWYIECVNKTLQIHKMVSTCIVIKTIHEHTRMHRVNNTVDFLTIRILLSYCDNFVTFHRFIVLHRGCFYKFNYVILVTCSNIVYFSILRHNFVMFFIFY